MKPEKGSEDMEDCVCDPIELFVDIGMLIVEGRIPDLSPKRRIEGPHCPTLDPTQCHRCDRHREQCRIADQRRKQMLMLCRNKIPMRVDVLLLPKCNHGQLEASTVDGASVSYKDTAMLLERWDVQIISKRLEKVEMGCVTGRFLLQAIRSYLHFSQLSSWMISSMGCLPFEVVYRLYAPGETVHNNFTMVPNLHNFPISDMAHATMKVSVASMPRPIDMPHLTCLDCDNGRQQKFDKFPKGRLLPKTPSSQPATERPHSSKSLGLDQYKLKSLESHHRRKKSDQSEQGSSLNQSGGSLKKSQKSKNKSSEKLSDGDDLDDNACLPSRPKSPRVSDEDDGLDIKDQSLQGEIGQRSKGQGKKSLYHKPPSGRKLNVPEEFDSIDLSLGDFRPEVKKKEENSSMQAECPESSSMTGPSHHCYAKNLLKESLKDKPLTFKKEIHSKHFNDSESKHFYDPDTLIKRLPSPKVLLTTNPKNLSTTYKKRKLDLDDLAENVEDKIMSSNISDLMMPLQSEELETYLASLSHRIPEKSVHDSINSIPLTKCKFFIGEGVDDLSGSLHTSDLPHYENKVEKSKVVDSHLTEKATVKETSSRKPTTGSYEREITSNIENLQSKETFQKNTDTSEKDKSQNQVNLQTFNLQNSLSSASQNKQNKGVNFPNQSSRTSNRDSVTRCLFKSLSEPGSEIEKLSLSATAKNKHAFKSVRDSSPNGIFTDDESSDNSTPTNSLSDKFTHNSYGLSNYQCSTSARREDLSVDDSLEIEIANLKLSEKTVDNLSHSNGVVPDKRKEDKMALGKSLCKHLMSKELTKLKRPEDISMPNEEQIKIFQKNLDKSSSMMFNTATGLPTRSSPAPTKRNSGGRFDYDNTLISTKAIKNALSCSKLALQSESSTENEESQKVLSTSAPASTNCLLGNFEESVLNGRIEPIGVVEGFTAEIGAGGSFCPKHITLPVTAYFFQLSDDNAPSPYLGHINLESLGKKGYKIPTSGTVQVTLFNPNKTVVKMFVVMYDLSDMPANCQTFLRQRTVYMPADQNSTEPSFLRYLIHLRFASSKTGKIYLHTDIRLIFARDKFEFDPRVANYELRSFTEGPQNPKFSPKR